MLYLAGADSYLDPAMSTQVAALHDRSGANGELVAAVTAEEHTDLGSCRPCDAPCPNHGAGR